MRPAQELESEWENSREQAAELVRRTRVELLLTIREAAVRP
jgi:hypothetical protein